MKALSHESLLKTAEDDDNEDALAAMMQYDLHE